jgi:hypothetical protein
MSKSSRILLFLLLTFGFGALQAQTAEDAYSAGVAAARAGANEAAASHFEEAQRGGMNTAALAYNIGVVNYKLGRFDAAAAAFLTLTGDEKWRALAHYNLGLTEERRGRTAAAQGHFRQAYALSGSPELRSLAERKLPAPVTYASPQEPRWQGLASFAAGHDDNVVLADDRPNEDVSDEADQFGEFLAAARRPIGSPQSGLAVDVSTYYRAHVDLDDFDFGALSAALLWRTPLGAWQFSTSLKGEVQFAGGDSYANVATHRLQVERGAGSVSWRARNDLSYLEGGSDYDFISGWRNRTQVQVGNQLQRAHLHLGYELEFNDRDDFTSGDEFASYSPTSHRIYAGTVIDIAPRLALDLEGDLRISDYRDANRFTDADGALVEGARDQDLATLRVRFDYRLSDRWRVWSQYQHTRSDSDLARYEYTSNAYMLGLETMF